MKKKWYDYLWIWSILYFTLGFFNILFAWLGMIDFLVPLFIALLGGNKAFQTWLVGSGAQSLREVVKLFWTFKVPWGWAYSATNIPAWIAQYSFGFYSIMLTSTLIGLIVMVLYKPRTWCSFCPMGTMTQTICKLKNRGKKNGNI